MKLPSWLKPLVRTRRGSDQRASGLEGAVRLGATRLEERRVLNGAPVATVLGTVGGASPASPPPAASPAAPTVVELSVSNGSIMEAIDGIVIGAPVLDQIGRLEIQATAGGTELVLNFAGGNPLPQGGIEFDGQNTLAGATNSIVVEQGNLSSIDYTFTGSQSGTIMFGQGGAGPTTVSFNGVSAIDDTASAASRSVQFATGETDTTLTAAAGGLLVDSSFGVNLTLANPGAQLTIDATAGSGASLDLAGALDLLGTSFATYGFDSVTLDGPLDLASGELTISAGSLAIAQSIVANGGIDFASPGLVSLAAGGSLSSAAAVQVVAGQVDDRGTVVSTGGQVLLDAGLSGQLSVSGLIRSWSNTDDTNGGTVRLLGSLVLVEDGAQIDASGTDGGGTVLVGGDAHGQGPDPDSLDTYVAPQAEIRADGLTNGSGGQIVVWSENDTIDVGSLSAQGGSLAGNGGSIEVSTRNAMTFQGQIALGAPHGMAGSLLLDPTNIILDNTTATVGTAFSLTTGTLTPSELYANDSGTVYFNVSANGSFAGIQSGATITLQATNSISVANSFNLHTATGNSNISLVLDAKQGITIGSTVTITADGTGTLTFDADASGGTGNFVDLGTISSNAAIAIQGNLVNTANINAGGGTIQITGTTVDVNGILTSTANGSSPAVAIDAATSLSLISIAAASGAVSLSVASASTVTQTEGISASDLILAGSATFSLTNSTNSIASLDSSISGSLTLVDGSTLTLGSSSGFDVGQNLTLTLPSSLSESNGVTVGGTLQITLTSSSGTVNLSTQTNNIAHNSITGTGTAGSSYDVLLANSNNSAVVPTFSSATVNNLLLNFPNAAVQFTNALSLTGNLTVTSGGAITQSAVLNVAGSTTLSAGSNAITLSNASNSFSGAVSLSNTQSNAVQINDALALTIGTSTLGSGSLTLQGKGIFQTGPITQSGSGSVTINAGTSAIQLTNASNSFGGVLTVNSTDTANVDIVNSGLLVLSTSQLGSGTVSLTGTGIEQSGAITSAGNITFNAGSGTLALNQSNLLSGTVTLNGTGSSGVILNDSDALVLATSSVGSGTLSITAPSISQTGSLTQAAGAATATFTANTGNLLLSAANSLTGVVSFKQNSSTGSISINDTLALTLASSSLGSGSLTLAGAGISQLAAITQSANGAVSLTTTGGDIALTNASNQIEGVVAVTLPANGSNASLVDNHSLTLGSLTLGSGTVAFTGIGISQTTPIATTAAAAFTTTGSGTLSLTSQNSFSGPVQLFSTGSGNVSLNNSSTLTLSTSTLSTGSVSITAAAITQSSAISSQGPIAFDATSGGIALTFQNSFTGAVGLNSTGSSDADVTANGTLTLSTSTLGDGAINLTAGSLAQTGAITQAQDPNGGAAGTVALSAGTGNIALNAANQFAGQLSITSSTTGSSSVNDTLALTIATATLGSGSLSLIGAGISQLNPIAATGTATFTTSGGTISLTSQNSFSGAVALNSADASEIDLTNSGLLTLAASSIGTGTLNLTAAGFAQSGAVAAGAAANLIAGNNAITLTLQNSFAGPLSLTNNGANDVAIVNGQALTLGSLSLGSGALSITGAGITQNSAVSATGTATFTSTGGTIALTAQNSLSGIVSLNSTGGSDVDITNNGQVTLGTSVVGTGTLNVTAIGITQAGTITTGGGANLNAQNGAISLSLQNSFAGAVTLNNTGAFDVNLIDSKALVVGTSAVGTGQLALTGAGISQTGAILQGAAAGTATFTSTGGDIVLNAANQLTGLLAVSSTGASNVSVTNSLAIDLLRVSLGTGALSLTGAGFTQQNAIGMSGTATFSATSGNIELTSQNSFAGAVSLDDSSGTDVNLVNSQALKLGTSNIGGATLEVTATSVAQSTNAPLTQSAAGGTLTFNAAGNITLDQANQLTGQLILQTTGTASVNVNDTLALTLGASQLGTGTLTLKGGGVTEAAAISQAPASGAISVNGGSGGITLNAQNTFSGPLSLTSSGTASVQVNDAIGLTLGSASLGSGALTLQGASIAQLAALTSSGTATFTATTGDINLNAANQLTGLVEIQTSNGSNATVNDTAALTLGPSTLGTGALTVTGAGISQTSPIATGGTASFTSTGGTIALTAQNSFSAAVSLSSTGTASVSLTNTGLLTLAASSVGTGLLNLTGAGIAQTGAVTQATGAGTATFTTTGGDIALTASNQLTGIVDFANSGADNVSLDNSLALTVGSASLGSGALSLTGTSISQAGPLATSGTATFQATAGNITLNGANSLSGPVSFVSSGTSTVSLNDTVALVLGSSTLGSGAFSVTGAGISQNGPLTVSGTATFTSAGGAIALSNGQNALSGSVSLHSTGAFDVNVVNSGLLTLGTSSVGTGILSLSGAGIVQTGAISQTTGAGAVDLTTSGGSIILASGNVFYGDVNLTTTGADNVNLNDTVALTLGSASLGSGTLALIGNGITQTVAISTSGTASFTTTGGNIVLGQNNTVSGLVSLSAVNGANVSLTDGSDLTLGAVLLGTGALTLTGASITQTGTITQAAGGGTASFSATTGGITLDSTNTIHGVVDLVSSASQNVSLNDSAALTIGSVTLGSGSLQLSGAGITQLSPIVSSGTASFTSTGNVVLNAANQFSGAVSFLVSGTASVSANDTLALSLGSVSLGTGTLSLTGAGISQASPITAGGTATFTSTGGTITLTAANSLSGVVQLDSTGGDDVDLTNTGALNLGLSSVSTSALNITAGSIGQSGAISQTTGAGASTFVALSGDLLLSAGNQLYGSVALTSSGTSNVNVNDTVALVLATSTLGTGQLHLTGNGISQTGALTQSGPSGLVQINGGSGSITLTAQNALTGNIVLLDTGAGLVQLTDIDPVVLSTSSVSGGPLAITGSGIAEVGTLVVGGTSSFNAGAGSISLLLQNTFSGAVSLTNSGTAPVSLASANSQALTLGTINVGTGAVTINGGGSLSQIAAFQQATGGGLVTFQAAGPINLTQANTFAGNVALTETANAAVNVNATSSITLATSTVGTGPLTVTAAGISQSGAIASGGTATFNAGSNAITLTSQNSFAGPVSLNSSGNNAVSLTNGQTLTLSTSNLGSGTLDLIAPTIVQSGAVTQAAGAGTTTFQALVGNVTLNAGNQLTGPVSLLTTGTGGVSLNDTLALTLASSTLGSGQLALTGAGISQLAPLVSSGTATFTSTGGDIVLSSANQLTGRVSASATGASNVNLNDTSALTLGSVTLGTGALTLEGSSLSEGGAITESAGAGAVSFTASTGGIGLSGANQLTGPVSLNATGANTVALNDTVSLTLASSTLGSGLLTLSGAGITQTSAISSSGTASFTSTGGDIVLTAANQLTGQVKLSVSGSNNVDLTDAAALSIGTATLGSGTLTLNGAGISQSGAITQTASAGTATFNAGAGPITLTASNTLTGAVVLTNSGANDVALTNSRQLTLATSSVGSGSLTVTAVGISENGTISQGAGSQGPVAGTATFNAGAGAIALASQNTFSGPVALFNSGANNVSLTNSGQLTLAASSVGSGTLTVTGLGISQTGAITQATGAGLATFSAGAGAITLTSSNAFTGAVALSNSGANDVSLTNSVQVALATSSVGSGTLNVTGVGISQTGAITQAAGAGMATFNAGAGAISLTSNNTFTGAVALSNSGANNVSLTNSGQLTLATSSVGSGSLTVSGVGISETGTIAQAASAGTATFNAGAGAISLASQNTFSGPVALFNSGANNVSLTNSGQLTLATSSIGSGQLTVTGLGITQTGSIVQAASATGASFNAGSGNIVLSNANQLSGPVALLDSGVASTTLNDALALVLAASDLGSGNVTIAGAGISQNGAFRQSPSAGSDTFQAGANRISLTAANQFGGPVVLQNSGTNDVTVTAVGGLTLGGSAIGSGMLTVNAASINQVGSVTQQTAAQGASFTATAGALNLSGANLLTGPVTLSVVGNFQGVVDDAGSLSLAGATLAGGPLSVTAAGGLQLLAAANVNTGNGTTTLEATGGSLTMATGSQINAGQGSVTLSASNSVALSTVNSLTLVVVSARGGAISGGATTAITAPSVALQAASGIGSAQPLSTATALLAATTGLGNLQIDNSGTLDIGNVSGVAGLTTTGGGSIALVNVGSISVSAPVTSAGGGSILINADATAGTSNLTISGPIAALGGGSINLIADRSLTILDSGQINDISVQGTGQIIASAQSYTIGPNVLLTSGTGAISEVPVSLTNVSSPQISSLGDSSITGNIGQAGDRNLTVTVDWADGAVTSTPVAAAGAFDVAHEYIGDPNKGNAQDPVSATVTVTSDPNIVFTGVNPVSAVVQAAIPGTGLTVFVTQLTQTVVLTTVMIIRLEEPVQLAAPVAAAEPAPIVVPPATQEKTTDERQVVLSVITATGDEKSVVRLPVGVLDDLPSLFQKLPDGHYRVYLNEPGAKHLRRVIDVQLRQGRPVAPRDESDTGESMSGTSRLEDTAPGRLVKGPASDESRGQSSALREDSPQAEIAVPHAPLADQPAPSAGPWQALLGGLGFLVGGASAGEFGSAGRLGRRLASGGKNPFGRGARAARKAKRSSDRSSPDR